MGRDAVTFQLGRIAKAGLESRAELVSILVPGEEVPIMRAGHLVTPSRESWPLQPGKAKGILTILAEDAEHLADFREHMA